jgi:hypothetical protein
MIEVCSMAIREENSSQVVELLLTKGADPRRESKDGNTVLDRITADIKFFEGRQQSLLAEPLPSSWVIQEIERTKALLVALEESKKLIEKRRNELAGEKPPQLPAVSQDRGDDEKTPDNDVANPKGRKPTNIQLGCA